MNVSANRCTLVLLAMGLATTGFCADKPAPEAAAAGFAALDVDHDGLISKYEYDGDRAFARMDSDHDNRLSADELQAFLPAGGTPSAAERIVVADLDADGHLDENELRAAAEMRYTSMDRNGDGNLDQAEFAAGFGVRIR